MKRWKAFLADCVDLLIPPACLCCGNRLEEQSQVLCENCEARLMTVSSGVCPVCGSEISEYPCPVCAEEDFSFDSCRSVFRFFGPAQELVHQLKYNGYSSPAGYFAFQIAELIETEPELQDHDCICAVPLHKVRKRERGYNQSELIAYAVSGLTGLPYIDPIRRKVNTLSQTLLSKEHRQKNLSGAFTVSQPEQVLGKKLILVDDVFTTGSTLNEISKTLRKAGAQKITALTATRA